MSKVVVPVADQKIGLSGHGGVDRPSAQSGGIHGIFGVGRNGPDGIAGIDIFQVDRESSLFKVFDDGILQKETDISEPDISGRRHR